MARTTANAAIRICPCTCFPLRVMGDREGVASAHGRFTKRDAGATSSPVRKVSVVARKPL